MNLKEMLCASENAKPHIELAISYLKEVHPPIEDGILSIEHPAEYTDALESLKEAAEYLEVFLENYREEMEK